MHPLDDVSLVAELNVPVGHKYCVAYLVMDGQYDPAGQSTGVVVLLGQYEPAGQDLHVLFPF